MATGEPACRGCRSEPGRQTVVTPCRSHSLEQGGRCRGWRYVRGARLHHRGLRQRKEHFAWDAHLAATEGWGPSGWVRPTLVQVGRGAPARGYLQMPAGRTAQRGWTGAPSLLGCSSPLPFQSLPHRPSPMKESADLRALPVGSLGRTAASGAAPNRSQGPGKAGASRLKRSYWFPSRTLTHIACLKPACNAKVCL